MADKSIEELREAEQVRITDLLLLQQSGEAKKVTGQTLIRDLAAALDGHGGISSVNKTSSGLTDYYDLIFADGSTYRITLTNGKGISTIAKVSTSGLTDTYRISYNDGTSTTFAVKNGEKGDKGDADHVHIKWAAVANPSASDMSDYPDAYIGIYTGLSATAPSNPSDYRWYQYKGAKGDKGDNATVTSSEVAYQVSDSGTVAPSGSWVTYIPTVAPGKFLWAKTTIRFNTGSPVVTYNVARFGIDGTGSVITVNNISPDPNGNVQVTASNIQMSDNTSVEAAITNAGSVKTVNGIKPDAGKNINLTAEDVGARSNTWNPPASGISFGSTDVNTILNTITKELGIHNDGTDYIYSFTASETADNAPMGLRSGQGVVGAPPSFSEWVLYATFYFDRSKTFGWQVAFNMLTHGIAYRYKRSSTWAGWKYVTLT